ncbi:MAG TPA: cyclomaltodextrinase C-terminal domain-containing protein, partial [Bacteroidota bacterium]|nr:cyclomaltodextrinase C-terminal domain-containing protein [Bacteroidota bacterium]
LTLRGIPEVLYGTELGLMGGKEHGMIRCDFPGGFPGDSLNAFTVKGRTAEEKGFFNEVRQLFHLRRERKSLAYGSMVHFPPASELYMYLRLLPAEKTLVLVNNRDDAQKASIVQAKGYFGGATVLKNLMTGATLDLRTTTDVDVPANDAVILGTP